MSDDAAMTFPPCVDCGEPDAGSCPGDRCRECDIDHLHEWLRCAECNEPTNVNDIALRLFGWHGYHAVTCSQYLPAQAPATEAEVRERIAVEAQKYLGHLAGNELDHAEVLREVQEWVDAMSFGEATDPIIKPT